MLLITNMPACSDNTQICFERQASPLMTCKVWHVILQVQTEAEVTFDGILQRQALLDKARQEQQLAVRFTSVLGFPARLQAFCQSCQYSQILPAFEQASALIQSQIQAVPDSHVDWGVLQTLMNQVSRAGPRCVHAVLSAAFDCKWLQLSLVKVCLQCSSALSCYDIAVNWVRIGCLVRIVSHKIARVLNACRRLLRPPLSL